MTDSRLSASSKTTARTAGVEPEQGGRGGAVTPLPPTRGGFAHPLVNVQGAHRRVNICQHGG